MKQKDLVNKLQEAGFVFKRHGNEHEIYIRGGTVIAVPRHREINEITARKILKQAGL